MRRVLTLNIAYVVWIMTIIGMSLNGRAEDLYNKQQMIAPINCGSKIPAAELVWSTTTLVRDGELFLTLHQSRTSLSVPQSIFSLYYGKFSSDYRLLKRITADNRYGQNPVFQNPKLFLLSASQDTYKDIFIQVTAQYPGTGVLRDEHLFSVDPLTLRVNDVEFIPARESLKKHLSQGEDFWKGEATSFSSEGLCFFLDVYKEGDGNGTPTGGKIEGRYKVTMIDKNSRKYRIEVDTFKRIKRNPK